MSLATSTGELSRLGIVRVGTQRDSERGGILWQLTCKCGASETIACKSPQPRFVLEQFQRAGWRVTHQKSVCPSCQRAKKRNGVVVAGCAPIAVPASVVTRWPLDETALEDKGVVMANPDNGKSVPLETVAKIFPVLQDNYDDAVKRYRNGWTDGKVAAQTGFSADIVCRLRESMYGAMVNPEIAALQSDIATLESMLADLKRRVQALDGKR